MKFTLSILTFVFATLFATTFAYAAYHNVFRRDGTIECCDVIHDGLGAGGGPSAYDCTSGTCGGYNEEETEEIASRENHRRDVDEEDNEEIEQARAREDRESREDEPREADEEIEQPEALEEDDVRNAGSNEGADDREGEPGIDPAVSRTATTKCDCPPMVTVSHSSDFEPNCGWICKKVPATPDRLEGTGLTGLEPRQARRAISKKKQGAYDTRNEKQSAAKGDVTVKANARISGEATDDARNNLCATVCPDYSVVWHECPGPAACLERVTR
jgi:hypothetical protein